MQGLAPTVRRSARSNRLLRAAAGSVAERLEPRRLLVAVTGGGLDVDRPNTQPADPSDPTLAFHVDFDSDVLASLVDGEGDLMIENLTAGWSVRNDGGDLSVVDRSGETPAGETRVALSTDSYRNSDAVLYPADGNYELTVFGSGVTDAGGSVLGGVHRVNNPAEFFFYNADFNRDRIVNLADFGIVRANFGATNSTFAQGDTNGDGLVNLADFGVLRARFGSVLAAPPVGSELSEAGQSASAIGLTWLEPTTPQDEVDDYDGFHIYRGIEDAEPTFFKTLVLADRNTPGGYTVNDRLVTWTDTGLVDGTRYTYFVRPFSHAAGNGTSTDQKTVNTVLPGVENLDGDGRIGRHSGMDHLEHDAHALRHRERGRAGRPSSDRGDCRSDDPLHEHHASRRRAGRGDGGAELRHGLGDPIDARHRRAGRRQCHHQRLRKCGHVVAVHTRLHLQRRGRT